MIPRFWAKNNNDQQLNISKLTIFLLLLFNSNNSFAIDLDILKISYIYKFIKFIELPSDIFAVDNSSFNLCIYDKDVFIKANSLLQDKKVKSFPISVRDANRIKDISYCHAHYLSGLSHQTINRMLAKPLKNKAYLTIGDSEEFVENGGIIGFTIIDEKLKFNINWRRAKALQIKISSKVLTLANKLIE